MTPESSEHYVFNLLELTSASAKRRFRESIKGEWSHCCAYCGVNAALVKLTLDHVRPRSYGGSSMRSNLVPACSRCNALKGSEKDWQNWFSQQEFFNSQRAARIEEWIHSHHGELSNWRFLGGGVDGGEPNSGTGIPLKGDCPGGAGAFAGGIIQRTTQLLGGQVSAETDLSGDLSQRGVRVQVGRRGNYIYA